MGGNTAPAQLNLEGVKKVGAYWSDPRYTGFFTGAEWLHFAGKNFFVVIEAFPQYNRSLKRNETALIPVVVGEEEEGQWHDFIGTFVSLSRNFSKKMLEGDDGTINPTQENVVAIFSSEQNLGKAISIDLLVYLLRQESLDARGQGVSDAVAQQYKNYGIISDALLTLVQEHFPDWASWFGDLPEEKQKALMDAIQKRGMLAVAVFEDDPALKATLQEYPLEDRPVGFFPWSVKPETIYKPDFGEWIYP